MTVIDCSNITGAKAPIAPVLNTPLLCYDFYITHSFSIFQILDTHKAKIVLNKSPDYAEPKVGNWLPTLAEPT